LLGSIFPNFCPHVAADFSRKSSYFNAIWRKGWDSNPRDPAKGLPVFKTGALNRSATLPSLQHQTLSDGGWRTNVNARHRIATALLSG
jgi:hypothetical protein